MTISNPDSAQLAPLPQLPRKLRKRYAAEAEIQQPQIEDQNCTEQQRDPRQMQRLQKRDAILRVAHEGVILRVVTPLHETIDPVLEHHNS